jgi:hypothetical protein
MCPAPPPEPEERTDFLDLGKLGLTTQVAAARQPAWRSVNDRPPCRADALRPIPHHMETSRFTDIQTVFHSVIAATTRFRPLLYYDAENENRAKTLGKSPQARPFLSHFNDNLAFCTSFLDVNESLFGRCEWKDPIHHWAYDPRIDERTDLAQLVSACSHEKE